uniref:chloroplast enveloppe membrane protein n=1 Tax=Massjukichlorella minus TaxID=2650457 RepID=UPI002410CEF9|nr:chloroplast enveloppe membrane protein [Massjukichlorella minus]WDY13016.1 chloroplast enveloppe membrane protein [Massjukichlorella minus]
MQKKVFERTGLIPRSIIRTFDRFLQQLLPGTEKLAIQEYRVSRYQILVSIKSLVTIICIPLFVNYTVKSFILTPLTEHFWNSREGQIFINAYQEKRAFIEMQDFSEKIYFESLLQDSPSLVVNQSLLDISPEWDSFSSNQFSDIQKSTLFLSSFVNPLVNVNTLQAPIRIGESKESSLSFSRNTTTFIPSDHCKGLDTHREGWYTDLPYKTLANKIDHTQQANEMDQLYQFFNKENEVSISSPPKNQTNIFLNEYLRPIRNDVKDSKNVKREFGSIGLNDLKNAKDQSIENSIKRGRDQGGICQYGIVRVKVEGLGLHDDNLIERIPESKCNISSETVYLQKLFQLKSLDIANRYNKQSILAITNLLGDFITFFTIYVLFIVMKPQIIILKSFLTESIYSLSDTTKSFLLILGMDLLVGFHSPRGWEIVLEVLLRHLGLPENENFILLFVALFPVFLDTVFKYWIFRYLNKISPSTVVTYHSMLE